MSQKPEIKLVNKITITSTKIPFIPKEFFWNERAPGEHRLLYQFDREFEKIVRKLTNPILDIQKKELSLYKVICSPLYSSDAILTMAGLLDKDGLPQIISEEEALWRIAQITKNLRVLPQAKRRPELNVFLVGCIKDGSTISWIEIRYTAFSNLTWFCSCYPFKPTPSNTQNEYYLLV